MTKEQLIEGNTLNSKLKAIDAIKKFLMSNPLLQDDLTLSMGQPLLTIGPELYEYLDIIQQDLTEKFQKL